MPASREGLVFERLEDRVLLAGDPPSAADDGYYLLHDTVLYAGSVLDNDYDLEYDPLTASLASGPSHGSLDFGSDGTFTYTPDTHFVGHDSFVYTVSDGTGTANATVHIDVSNGAPSTADDEYVISHDHVLDASQSVLFNDYDSDNDVLTVSVVTGPSHGSLDFRADGTFVYTPDAGFVGIDTFVYAVTDGIDTTPGTATIYVLNDAPYAEDDYGYVWTNPTTGLTTFVNYFVLRGNSLSVSATDGVLRNDTDPDATDIATLTAHLVSNGVYGTASLNSDGSFSYTPNDELFDDPGFAGLTDTFTYYTQDRHGAQSGYAVAYVELAMIVLKREVQSAVFEWTFETLDHPQNGQPWVGEEVALKAEIVGNVVAPVSYQWTIQGRVVQGYSGTGSVTEATVNELEGTDLQNQTIAFYWVDGGMKTAAVQVTSMNQAASKSVGFDVYRPPAQFAADTTSVNYVPAEHLVTFGNPGPPGEEGITLSYGFENGVTPEDDRGRYTMTQLVASTLYRQRVDVAYVEMKSGFGVDDSFTYPIRAGDGWVDSPVEVLPVPGQGAWPETGLEWMSREDSFQSYLMYNPQRGKNSIYVPLQVI